MNENPDIPPVIYHYCGVDAFHGILKSKKLWLSDVHFTNDTREQTHLIDVAKEVLRNLLRGPNNLFIQLLIQNFEGMRQTPYAFCFCEDGDVLSQWCRYADDGDGFAVGFSSAWLREQSRKYGLLLSGVEYDDDSQLKLVNIYIDRYLEEVRGLDRNDRDGRREVSMRAIASIWGLSAACKNRGFREEREVRLIAVEITHSEWRAKKSGISRISRICHRGANRIPYYRLGFPEEAITEIRLGPTNCEREDRIALDRFLKKHGYDCDRIRIEPSNVPYCH